MGNVLVRSCAVATMVPTLLAPATAAAREVLVCEFPEAGRAVIDTREPGASVTVGGTRYPVQSGSYFLQGTEEAPLVDGHPFVIFFGPDMAFWDLDGERSRTCARHAPASSASDPSVPATADGSDVQGDHRRPEGAD